MAQSFITAITNPAKGKEWAQFIIMAQAWRRAAIWSPPHPQVKKLVTQNSFFHDTLYYPLQLLPAVTVRGKKILAQYWSQSSPQCHKEERTDNSTGSRHEEQTTHLEAGLKNRQVTWQQAWRTDNSTGSKPIEQTTNLEAAGAQKTTGSSGGCQCVTNCCPITETKKKL